MAYMFPVEKAKWMDDWRELQMGWKGIPKAAH